MAKGMSCVLSRCGAVGWMLREPSSPLSRMRGFRALQDAGRGVRLPCPEGALNTLAHAIVVDDLALVDSQCTQLPTQRVHPVAFESRYLSSIFPPQKAC